MTTEVIYYSYFMEAKTATFSYYLFSCQHGL